MAKLMLSIGTAQIRKLIEEILRTDAEFDAFCLDEFPAVKRRFPIAMERLAKENLLLESVEHKSLLEKLQLRRPAEFEAHVKKLIEIGEITAENTSPWPEMSPAAEDYMNRLKELYMNHGYPYYTLWQLSPDNDDEYDIYQELAAHDVIEPFTMAAWRLTYSGMHLLLDAIPMTKQCENFLTYLASEYKRQKFPSYQGWAFEIPEDMETVASECRSRGFIEPFTMAHWILTNHGKDVLIDIIRHNSATTDKKS